MGHRWTGILAISAIGCTGAGLARAEPPHFENVLSAVTLDFTGKGEQDRAVLVQNKDEGADLYLYLLKYGPASESALAAAEIKKGVAFSGSMWVSFLAGRQRQGLAPDQIRQSIDRARPMDANAYRSLSQHGIPDRRDCLYGEGHARPKGRRQLRSQSSHRERAAQRQAGRRDGRAGQARRLVGRKIAKRMPFLTAAAPVAKQAMALRKRETRYSTGRQRSPTL